MNTSDRIYLPRRRVYPSRVGDVPRDGLSMWHDYTQNRGATAQDLSGIGNDGNDNAGTIAGTPKLPLFDGADDAITVANHASLQFGTGDFAIHVWTEAPSSGTIRTLVSKDDRGFADKWAFYLEGASGGMVVFENETTTFTSTTPIDNTGRYLCSVIRKDSVLNIYVNARLESSAADIDDYSGADDLLIGSQAGDVELFIGFLYQVYIYKKTFLNFQDAEQDMN
ncbi:hypothetical protein LCGC14_1628520, partial [marine sediment metagenome]